MEKTYSRINWENFPSVATPVNDKNLNKMDEALNEVDNRVLGLDTAKLDKGDALTMVKDVDCNLKTGVITITYLNGSTKKFNTLLEKVIVNYRFDHATQSMILVMQDGSEMPIDLSAFITPNEFVNSDTIAHEVDANGKVTSRVVDGSITEEKLEPNYLAKIKVETSSSLANKQAAESSATESTEKALESKSYAVGGTGVRDGENTDNAKYYSEQAKKHCENASVISGVEIAKTDRAGLVKGGDNYIAEDGTLTLTMETTDKTMQNSRSGGIKVIEIGGKSEQKQYSGKNLYSGGDQSFTRSVDVPLEKELPVGTYTVSAVVTSNDTDYETSLVGFIKGGENGANVNKTLARDKRSAVVVTIVNPVKEIRFNASMDLASSTGDTATWKDIQIEVGDTATDYEPYVGGEQSPNPNYPQEIKKVVLKGAKSVGKNLFSGWIIGESLKSSGEINVNDKGVRTDFIPINSNEIYTLSGMKNGEYGFVAFYDRSKNFIKRSGADVNWSKDILNAVRTSECAYVILTVYESTVAPDFSISNLSNEIQIEVGNIATDYEPYQESSITFTNPITLNGIDENDCIVRKDGVWGIDRQLKEVVFDGSSDEGWELRNGTTYIYRAKLSGVKNNLFAYNEALCDGYIHDSSDNANMSDKTFKVGVPGGSTNGYIYVNEKNITTAEEFVAQLKANPITVVYPLEEPVFEPLPTADQIALNSLLSFDGVTHLYFDSEIEPTSLVEYGTSHVGALTLEAWNKAENNRLKIEEILTIPTE